MPYKSTVSVCRLISYCVHSCLVVVDTEVPCTVDGNEVSEIESVR